MKTIADFDAELAAVNLFGQWNAEAQLAKLTDGPSPAGQPMVWSYPAVRAKLDEACVLFPESLTARRNVTFITPGLQRRGTTPSIIAGMQLVLPGEIAWAHRHSIDALRFVVEGDPKLFTVVDGAALMMETNDLILTPSYTWHDHRNEGPATGVWLDVLNVPLIAALNQAFYEPYGESVQPIRDSPGKTAMRYPWRQMDERLRSADGALSPHDGVRFPYLDPDTGVHVMPSMGCYAQLLPPAFRGFAHRHTSSSVYYVVAGRGSVAIDGASYEWTAKDSFAVPGWSKHHLVNASATDPAILFSVTDDPLLAALGLLREEDVL